MILESKELQRGKEKNYGVWGDKKREFKLGIRWNEKKSVYECFKLYIDTNEEEILFNSKKLVDITLKTCNLANYFHSIISID
ncbi:MAG: hypothetical protein HWN67_09855 [Candidatus Helarchaeota archaeon]|nr:hypothetical protein [Candidatus Helarchaeota archaeon]